MGTSAINESVIQSFIKDFFFNERTIMLFGSNKELSNNESDVDILILSKHITSFTREIFRYGTQIFDVTIIPLYEVYSYLERDKYLRVYVDIFTKGKILFDGDNTFANIIKILQNSKIPENSYLRKIQLEKNIIYFSNKFLKSKNIYEAEIYFNKLSENIYLRRLLDFGFSNIDTSKHLVEKILRIDLYLVEVIYKLKKKLLQYQDIHVIQSELTGIINISSLWGQKNYSNRFISNEIYSDRMVIFLQKNKNFEIEIENLLQSESLTFYKFSVDQHNIYKQGKYYIILEDKEKIKTSIFPSLENIFFKDLDLIENDSKIIFPYLLDISTMLGATEIAELKRCEDFFILLMRSKSVHDNNILYIIIYQIMLTIENIVNAEELIGVFAGKSNFLNNYIHLAKSQQYLIALKNKFYNEHVSITPSELGKLRVDILDHFTNSSSKVDEIKSHLSKIFENIPNSASIFCYNFLNMTLNIFEIEDYRKPYLLTIMKKIIRHEV